eukprot:CAMPEP_0119314860 /NCGR_PEP_ID=MMETSP1333-20130426/34069_1 /TAXON_ID=418940 /ORGANISM="Scyphosphaera apsteinii, Strain RCC1455" /LENGTH=340 /DNA_ID=CAMNT_0007320059 /DNA_START=109 /DNA_END=1131 /DNA_ORIENTATION=-
MNYVKNVTNHKMLHHELRHIAAAAFVSLPDKISGIQSKYKGIPGPGRLFVFWHQRKAGGSTMRKALLDAAQNISMGAFIPCYNGTACDTYAPPDPSIIGYGMRPYYILGGHLYRSYVERWDWLWHIRENEGNHPFSQLAQGHADAAPLCFTQLREPVSRVESCWNYRMVAGQRRNQLTNLPLFHEMEEHELDRLLPNMFSMWGEGCNNEAARVLSSVGMDDARVNRLNLSKASPMVTVGLGALHEVLHELPKCIIGVLERCEDTMANLRAHLPWLARAYDCNTQVMNTGAMFLPRNGSLPPDRKQTPHWARLAAVVHRHNVVDEVAYRFANKILDMQLGA